MSEGLLAVDNNRRILMVNNTGKKYLNINTKNPTGEKIDNTIKDKRFLKFLNHLLSTKQAIKEEIKIKKIWIGIFWLMELLLKKNTLVF